MQVMRWLNVFGDDGIGPAIFYDSTDPFQGRSSASSASASTSSRTST